MSRFPEGNAIVYCQGALATTNGKTAHGLIRRSERYNVLSVVDARHAREDAGTVLDGKARDIPVHPGIPEAVAAAEAAGRPATHLVVGLAPDGGRLAPAARADLEVAIRCGLHVDAGLHDFLSEDPRIAALADERNVRIRDIRKPPPRSELHFFCGKIEEVTALKVAVLGTDSAVGKRTTAWVLVDALRVAGYTAEMIGTGQTAWMQGAPYTIVLDSLVNDFVAGEIEHVVWRAWDEKRPDVIVIEGQGSLMNPAYPGGFEILAAGRPDGVVLQHAPARKEYDGFPGYRLHPLEKQIQAIEFLSGRPVIAITINHEKLEAAECGKTARRIRERTNLPACDVLLDGAAPLVAAIARHLEEHRTKVAAGGKNKPANPG